jgi:DNA replication protein DnaC
MKRIVLTTNLQFKDFGNRYGDRILSRIAEMCVLVELKGEDKRLT